MTGSGVMWEHVFRDALGAIVAEGAFARVSLQRVCCEAAVHVFGATLRDTIIVLLFDGSDSWPVKYSSTLPCPNYRIEILLCHSTVMFSFH